MSKNPNQKSHSSSVNTNILSKLINYLCKEEDAQPFLHPVNFRELGLLDYPVLIKNPMDLSTLRKNLKNNKYKNYESFTEDLSLIWSNCKIYNLEGSKIYGQADRMEKAAKKILSNLFKKKNKRKNSNFIHRTSRKQIKKEEEEIINLLQNNDMKNEADSEEKNYKDRIKICQILKKLQKDQLIEVIKIIERNNGNAIQNISEEKFDIHMEEISSGTITRIFTYFDKIKIMEKLNNYI